MARECGKVVTECRAEVVEGLHMIQYVFGTGRMPIGDVLASEIAEKDAFMRRKPWGVVAVITPWNFPFAVPLWMLGPSLLEGNTAVFKPSEDTPAIGQRLVELFEEAGFPPGVINLVHGDAEAGEALVRNPDVNVVLFTGSYEVGQRIQQLSAEHYDRIVACEMGSKSAVIVCDDARLDLAVNCAPHQRLQDQRPALRLGGPHPGRREALRPLRREVRGHGQAAAHRRPARRRQLHRPGHPPRRRREGAERYNDLARKEGATVLLDGGRMTHGEHARRLLPVAVHLSHGASARRALHPRGGLRPAPGADPVQDQRGRGAHLQRHATTACRWR